MTEAKRNSYSLYARNTGTKTVWYVRFWDDDAQAFGTAKSTAQTTKTAAHRLVQKWLTEGVPGSVKKEGTAKKKALVNAIARYLEEQEVIGKGEKHDEAEIVKLFYAQITNEPLVSNETFVDHLYAFWNWDGDYVQGQLDRGKSIGRRYVNDCLKKIENHIAPYFKDTLLSDVTTLLLEQFMRSFPRRENDPKNGYSKSTINMVMKVITKPLKEAVRLGLLPRNPADAIMLLAEDTREKGILTPAELEGLFQRNWPDERSKTAAILAAVTGMRMGEIVGLRIDDIDAVRNTIHVRFSYTTFENRLKDTKNHKSRMIYTDSSIIKLLVDLYGKNPHQNSYVFYGPDADKPMRFETTEYHFERTLASLLGDAAEATIDDGWRELAQNIASKLDIGPEDMIAVHQGNMDTTENCIRLLHSYRWGAKKAEQQPFEAEKCVYVETVTFRKLSAWCGRNSRILIVRGKDRDESLDFATLPAAEAQRLRLAFGEIVRRERNVTFHSFRHFNNSTLRGTVSDDILRLQTGHLDPKMTDHYDHITDERGELLRKAVQQKILPFIPKG